MSSRDLDEFYDNYSAIEEEFSDFLDESLHPRGPELLLDIVASLGLPRGADVLDLGCGDGKRPPDPDGRFGFSVLGVDPVASHIEIARERAAGDPNRRFALGTAEAIPSEDGSIDLIWCREAVVHMDLPAAFAECRRVLRPAGRMLIYQNFPTELLEPREAAFLGETGRLSVAAVEGAYTAAGFVSEHAVNLGSEIGEHFEEHGGEAARRLLHASRLRREPQRYIARFGQANYEIMLADCYWHVYRMIGKLSGRVSVLKLRG